VCGDCILEQLTARSSDHSGHGIVRASDLLDTAREALKSELAQLRTAFERIDEALDLIRLELRASEAVNDDIVAMIVGAFRAMKQRLDTVVIGVKSAYTQQLTELRRQASIVQSLVDEAELYLMSDDFRAAGKLQQFIEKVGRQVEAMQIPETPQPPPPLPNEIVPPFETIEIVLRDFPTMVERYRPLNKEEDRFIYSNQKEMHMGLWRVKIFPCGNDQRHGTHLSVFLELLIGPKKPVDFTHRLVVFHTTDPGRDIVRELSSRYERMDSWGWSAAAPLDVLLADGEFLSGKHSVLRCAVSVRPESYRVLYGMLCTSYEEVRAKRLVLEKALLQDPEGKGDRPE
jgi:hypothetical protein